MANQVIKGHKSNMPVLQMLVHNRPAPVSNSVRLTNITGSQSFSCVEAAVPSCFGCSDTRWYTIRCCRYAVFSVPALPLWLMHDCQRLEEREMAHSLSTFIITSGETVFSSAPQRGKTCAMMQPAHDQQWNSLATNSIINFCCCCCCYWLRRIIVGALKLFFLSCYRPMVNIQERVVKRCWPHEELCRAFCSNIIAANTQRKIALNFKTLLLPAIRINLDCVWYLLDASQQCLEI